MTAANFGAGLVAVPYAAGPGFGGYQYHRAKIALHKAIQEIQNPAMYPCPMLALVPSGIASAVWDLQLL
jgi:hypothetical protein